MTAKITVHLSVTVSLEGDPRQVAREVITMTREVPVGDHTPARATIPEHLGLMLSSATPTLVDLVGQSIRKNDLLQK